MEHTDDAGHVIEAYLLRLQAERNPSPLTLRNYGADLCHFAAWLTAEGLALTTVDRRSFRRYLAALDSAGTARASIARKVSTIHTFYRRLRERGLIDGDPLHGVRPPKQERRLPKILAEPAVEALLEVPDAEKPLGLRDRAIAELLYASGLRVSELVGLNIRDADQDTGLLRVTGKGNKQRVVLFGAPAARALRAYLRNGRPALASGRAEAALFLNRDGGRLSARAVQRMVQQLGQAAGVNGVVYPHLLRHSFATHMLDGGADVRVVQELLGHAKASTTQIYTHVTEARQRAVYDRAFFDAWRPRGAGFGVTDQEDGEGTGRDRHGPASG